MWKWYNMHAKKQNLCNTLCVWDKSLTYEWICRCLKLHCKSQIYSNIHIFSVQSKSYEKCWWKQSLCVWQTLTNGCWLLCLCLAYQLLRLWATVQIVTYDRLTMSATANCEIIRAQSNACIVQVVANITTLHRRQYKRRER